MENTLQGQLAETVHSLIPVFNDVFHFKKKLLPQTQDIYNFSIYYRL